MDLHEENINWLMQSAASVEKAVEDDEASKMRAEEDRQLYLFMEVLKSSFESEPVVINPNVFGICKSFEEYSTMLRNLKALGYFFSIRTSRKKNPSDNKRIMFRMPSKINTCHPYTVEKAMRLYCSVGRNHNKEVRKRCNEKGQSPKVTDCKAVIIMKEVHVFNKFKVSSNKQFNLKILRTIKAQIEKGIVEKVHQFWVWVSLPRMHHHSIQLPSRDVDPEVKACMLTIIQNKNMTIQDVKEKLIKMLKDDFANKPVKPEKNNTAFYPTDKVIYNHLRHEGLIMKKREKKEDVTTVRNKLLQQFEKLTEVVNKTDDISELKQVLLSIVKFQTKKKYNSIS